MRRALLLPTVLLLAACGGGGGGGEDDPKAEYVSKATSVCEDAGAQRDALKAPAAAAEFAPYADALVMIAQQAQTDLTALEPPSEDREELETKVFQPFSTVVDEGRAFAAQVRAAGADQAKLLPLLAELPDAGEVDLEYLRSYGLGACADLIDTA